jgi:hypothetical protein
MAAMNHAATRLFVQISTEMIMVQLLGVGLDANHPTVNLNLALFQLVWRCFRG